mgnify:CR=1 FL=1
MECHYWLIVRHLVISLSQSAQFFLLYYLIRKFAWDQITGIFAAREKKIATDIDSAENARQEAEKLGTKNVKMS